MLIGNYSVVSKHPGKVLTGDNGVQNLVLESGSMRGRFFGSSTSSNGMDTFNGSSVGYKHPYAWFLPQISGGLGSTQIISGSGVISSFNLAAGLSASSGLTGSGYILPLNGELIVQAVSLILGTGSVYYASLFGNAYQTAGLTGWGSITNANSSAITGLLASAVLTGSGFIVSASTQLGALAGAVAGLTGIGYISMAIPDADGTIAALISTATTLSPENLSAAVWNAVSADFNDSGTMGNKVNSAASAGDPWSTVLPGSYTNDQAGAIVDRLEDLINQIKQLTIAQM